MQSKAAIWKNFAIGFLPIFVFIIVDEFYGVTAGMVVAVLSGILYFLYYLIRFRRLDWFILFDTVLIILMGGVSLLLHDDLFFKLKPALIELILVAVLGVHAFSDTPLLLNMSRRYMADMEIQPQQAALMKTMSRLLFAVFLVHVALIVYAARYLSDEAWAFISGGLFYILFGVIAAGQWVYFKWLKKPSLVPLKGDEEWFDVVDAEDRVVGRAPRSVVHGNPKLLHRVVHLHIFNRQGQLYLQKRSAAKDLYPGRWDTAVGGHVSSGEEIMAALQRESEEELGVRIKQVRPLFRYIMSNPRESEMVHSFATDYSGPFRINRQEVEVGRFWKIGEIRAQLGRDVLTPNFEQEFAMLEKNGLFRRPGDNKKRQSSAHRRKMSK